MTTRYLDKLFKPSSIAVIGASNKPGRVGNIVMHNILQGGFDGPVMPVNPKYAAVAGVLTYPNIESLPITPDMAVICTPPKAIPALIRDLGNRGTRAAIVLTAGLESAKTDDGVPVSQAMLDAAKPNLLRILGSNCLGILLPGIKLNASFSHLPAVEGRLAFVSQSGALCTAVLDWACLHDTGFSHLISLGNMSDIDFGDVIDYLAGDPKTDAILLYIEAITDGRKFMSACRAAARNKPVLAIKSGVAPEGAKAATTHTGALAGSDRVYDAVFQRAGLLRVHDIEELFNAVETLSRAQLQKGDRLAILTNGGGIGVMATDQLIDAGGTLASLSDDTLSRLNVDLPKTWSHRNPVDIIGDAPGTRYANALRTLVDSPDCDAVLVMHAPTATANSVEAATAVIDVAKTSKINVLANWVGGVAVEPGRKLFREAGVPSFDTPRRAIQAFTQMVAYRRSQAILMEVPPSTPRDFTRSTDTVRAIIQDRLTKDSHMMNEAEAKMVLAAYDIPQWKRILQRRPVWRRAGHQILVSLLR